jgi:hypothetical protein
MLKKYKLQKATIDKFIDSLEEMIDARDDMWQEEQNCNYREMWKIKEQRYLPAKKALKKTLYAFIAEVIEEEEPEQ